MANLVAGGIKSFGEFSGVAGNNSGKVKIAFDIVESKQMQSTVPNSAKVRPRVIVIEEDLPDKVDVHDLDIHPLSVVTGTHLLDFICDYDGELCVNHVVQTIKNNTYSLLPGPFREKAPVEIGYWLSINIYKQPNGKYRILKWYLFTDKPDRKGFQKLTNALVHGQAFQPHWVGSAIQRITWKT